MSAIRIMSVSDAFSTSAESYRRVLDIVFRAEVMNLLPRSATETGQVELDLDFLRDLTDVLNRAGIARAPRLAELDGLDELTRSLWHALDDSPHPAGEWKGVRAYLDDEQLGDLLGISPSSLRRYATGVRETPDEVARRLHVLGRIVAALIGSYNPYGVRRWFERPRTQLDGRTPAQVFAAVEDEDDPRLVALVALAEALVGPSLAA